MNLAWWTTCTQACPQLLCVTSRTVGETFLAPEVTLALQLVLFAATAILAAWAASSARRAASFDVTRDFDALSLAVSKIQQSLRSTVMAKVRAAALTPRESPQTADAAHQAPLTKDQLRALVRARNGVTQ